MSEIKRRGQLVSLAFYPSLSRNVVKSWCHWISESHMTYNISSLLVYIYLKVWTGPCHYLGKSILVFYCEESIHWSCRVIHLILLVCVRSLKGLLILVIVVCLPFPRTFLAVIVTPPVFRPKLWSWEGG